MIPPLSKTNLLRWSNGTAVVGGVLVAAPQDTNSVLGIDPVSAKMLWENANLPPGTLVGTCGGFAILNGQTVLAIDPKNGNSAWTFQPPPKVRITGPAVIVHDQIRLMSTAGLMAISGVDGQSQQLETAPSFHAISASDTGKTALAGVGAIGEFGMPPAANKNSDR